jgi:hypothetical protein
MRLFTLMSITLVFVGGACAHAERVQNGCSIKITSPAASSEVGPTAEVSGTADIPDGTRLWVLAHRQDLQVWWPQGGEAARLGDGHAREEDVYFGEPRDIGHPFEIRVAAFGDAENRELQEWINRTARTGQYPGMLMPVADKRCDVQTILVKKTG